MGVVKYPEKENHDAPIWAVTPKESLFQFRTDCHLGMVARDTPSSAISPYTEFAEIPVQKIPELSKQLEHLLPPVAT